MGERRSLASHYTLITASDLSNFNPQPQISIMTQQCGLFDSVLWQLNCQVTFAADVRVRAERRRVSLPGELQATRRVQRSGTEASGTWLETRVTTGTHARRFPRLHHLCPGRQQRGFRSCQSAPEIRRLLRWRKQVSNTLTSVQTYLLTYLLIPSFTAFASHIHDVLSVAYLLLSAVLLL